ncbi:hypothetical protein [Kitasatospora sp. NPDC086791]
MNDYLRFLAKPQDDSRDELLRIAILTGLVLMALALAATTIYALTTP